MNDCRRCVSHKSRGAAAVEFALAAMLFFTLLFSIMDFGYLFWVNLTMQHAVREGARTGILRESSCSGAEQVMRQQSMGLWEKVQATDTWQIYDADKKVFVGQASNCLAPAQTAIREPGQIVVVTVACKSPLLTPFMRPFFKDGVYSFTVSSTVRME